MVAAENGERSKERVKVSGGDRKDGLPEDDCCPICHDDFHIPCRTNCGHWFCSNCILHIWENAEFKQCACPVCESLIFKLVPHSSTLIQPGEKVSEILEKIKRYSSQNVVGWFGNLKIDSAMVCRPPEFSVDDFVCRLPEFSVDDYVIWKKRVKTFLIAKHYLMWEIITHGPIPILVKQSVASSKPGEDVIERMVPKKRADYTSNECAQAHLDDYAQCVISSAVGDNYLPKIMNCETAKEMWDALAKLYEESYAIRENKYIIACHKIDNFTQLRNESIQEMELRFSEIIKDVESFRPERYTQREKNLKALEALSSEWSIHKIVHQNRADLKLISTELLFSILKLNEYRINRTKGTPSST